MNGHALPATEATGPGSRPPLGLSAIVRIAILGTLGFLVALETTTRIDQWIRYGAPLLGVYTYDSALLDRDEWGLRGRPNGHFEKWELNSFGLRGPEVAPHPVPGRIRIVALGASETFGLYESEDGEWPRVLERELRGQGLDVEVLNGAVAGMSAGAQLNHLRHRLLALQPEIVLWVSHYAMFAGRTPDEIVSPAPMQEGGRASLLRGVFEPRSLQRVHDAMLARMPTFLRETIAETRTRARLARLRASMGSSFGRMTVVTGTERASFEVFVRTASDLAASAGARFVVVLPPWRLDEPSLELQYLSFPHVAASWIHDAMDVFHRSGVELAKSLPITVIDLRSLFDPDASAYMVDAVHFNDAGARSVAHSVARDLDATRLLASPSHDLAQDSVGRDGNGR